ncbi:gamma-glutamyl-gamma-aminobutyrate hydrolase family protein [Pseudenhygromyxa sp. WMMC2535]|uniref:gamma-glutamyl-gamma-aminobutyrate hydrolase family protein n=1 Tax=Pseudenhygromyxa sp. WMMC2535 TaxID=2712867 RepID=UPI0015536A3A|nr:gamma-glutamyl-gamma-aminobutyrate hydrolase family protein [Pseudenhygromyxa sp. WMMC2535]NVB42829.1 gamma-glutamyl-gamma-aminobutyrate hydrolase family protein [Pseudenhygromyxa sp. WMMC2535]
MSRRPKIAITSCLMHEDPDRKLFKGKALQFTEKKFAKAVWRGGGLPMPLLELDDRALLEAAIAEVDGLLLQGGADVSPTSYSEEPMRPEWHGDRVRDLFEIAAMEIALAQGKPVFGICRGIQLINVALGGSLYQDINTQVEDSLVHRDWHRYEVIEHGVRVDDDSWLGRLYGRGELLTNTIHHQAIKDLAPGLRATAWAPDGITEAVEDIGSDRWIAAVQWHPEWLDGSELGGPHRTPGGPIFERFIAVCGERGRGS